MHECNCYISSEYNKDDNKFYLSAYLYVKYNKLVDEDKKITLQIPIMRTYLESSEWCESTLAITATSGVNKIPNPDYMTVQPLKLNKQFQLCAINDLSNYDKSIHHQKICVAPWGNDDYGDGSLGYNINNDVK